MEVWPLPLVATKWLNSVSVVLYVYAPSTLACSLKWVRLNQGLVELDQVSQQKKKKRGRPWVGPFFIRAKIFEFRRVQNKRVWVGLANFGPFCHVYQIVSL